MIAVVLPLHLMSIYIQQLLIYIYISYTGTVEMDVDTQQRNGSHRQHEEQPHDDEEESMEEDEQGYYETHNNMSIIMGFF